MTECAPAESTLRWLSGSGVYICCAMASSVVRQRCEADSCPEHGEAERTSRPQSGAVLRERETRRPVGVLAIRALLLRKPEFERIVLAGHLRSRHGLRICRERDDRDGHPQRNAASARTAVIASRAIDRDSSSK